MKNGEALEAIFRFALSAVDSYGATAKESALIEKTMSGAGASSICVLAFGKASVPMARAIDDVLGAKISSGIVLTKYGHSEGLSRIGRMEALEASHPLPDENGVIATRKILDLARGLDEKSLAVCLVSGGGSALLVSPVEGITLDEKRLTTDLLLKSGADIVELNTVRKHISAVKGGKLARVIAPARTLSLIVSDVIGDKLDTIASGPTAPDLTTYKDAILVLQRRGIYEKAPRSVIEVLNLGAQGRINETPKDDDPVFRSVTHKIICGNSTAIASAEERARDMGCDVETLAAPVCGEARVAAGLLAGLALRHKADKTGRPLAIISGGETTVTVRGNGKGGRNMEMALAFAEAVKGVDGITFLSAGTDGTDGPTDAAGAVVDGMTISRAESLGINADEYLANNDSYHFFSKAGGLLVTGPTGTNVMDLQITLIE